MKRIITSIALLLLCTSAFAAGPYAWTTKQSGVASKVSSDATSPWYDNSTQSGWATIPADGDTSLTVAAAHNLCWDIDGTAWTTGIGNVVVTGGATPGMLYGPTAANTIGFLTIKTGATLSGTTSTNQGRLLMNSDGVWAHSVASSYDRKFVISLLTTAKIDCTNLAVHLYCAQPTYFTVATYGTKVTVASVQTAADTITITGMRAPFTTNGTVVMFQSSGTLPAPLLANTIYYTRGCSGNTLQLERWPSTSVIDLTTAGSGTIEIYSGGSNSPATDTINVLTDVSGDASWAYGTAAQGYNAVVLESPDSPSFNTGYDVQRTTIKAITSTTIQFNNNLTGAKKPGAMIVLCSRNVGIRSNSTTSTWIMVDAPTAGDVFNCAIRNTACADTGMTTYGYGMNNGDSASCTGAVFANLQRGVSSGSGHTLTNPIFAGDNYSVSYGSGHTLTNPIFAGDNFGVYYGSGLTLTNPIFAGDNYGVSYGSGHTFTNGSFSNKYDLYVVSQANLFNCTLGGTTPNYGYNTNNVPLWSYVASYKDNTTPGSQVAYTRGGKITSQTSNPPTGYTTYFNHVGALGTNDTTPCQCFRQEIFVLMPGQTIRVVGWIKLGADETGGWAPRIEILDQGQDPLVNPYDVSTNPTGFQALTAALVASLSDHTNWQYVACHYTNPQTIPMPVVVRVSTKHATDTVSEVFTIAQGVGLPEAVRIGD